MQHTAPISVQKLVTQYRRRIYKCNIRLRTIAFNVPQYNGFSINKFSLYLPHQWDATLLISKNQHQINKLLYLYTPTYYFKWVLNNSYLYCYFDIGTQTFQFSNRLAGHNSRMCYKRILELFYSFSKIFFQKLKFTGKGYYIYKTSRNTITHQFNYAHRWYIYAYFISVKFLTKRTVFLFGWSRQDLLTVGYTIQNCRYINIFTGRGVRFAKQVSSYR